ncbi:MAG: acyl-protein synthetase [Polyangiaceae bacterium]
MSPDERLSQSDALHVRARAFVSAYEAGRDMPESFDALAVDIARFQARFVEPVGRLAKARGVDLGKVTRAADVPAVPTDVFKLTRMSAFPAAETPVTFRTSGTTIGTRGEHPFRTLATYDAGALAFGTRALVRDLLDRDGRVPVIVMGPPPSELPDSSLTHMMRSFVESFGETAEGDVVWGMDDGVFDLARLDERIARLLHQGKDELLVLGTSFAFVHLLDALDGAPFRLPPRARVMQTGGYKGRSREVAPETLRRDLAAAFGIPTSSIGAEYGMTELSSQFYESVFFDPAAKHGVFFEPPWARVVPVHPETLEPVPEGEVGIARIHDLANVDSASALLVPDRVRRTPGGFELLGRTPGAAPRGCSIAVDEIMAGVPRSAPS